MERVVLKQATETPKTLKYGLGIKLLKMSKAKNGFPRVKASKTAIQNQLIYLLTLDSGLSDNCTFFVNLLFALWLLQKCIFRHIVQGGGGGFSSHPISANE